MGTFLNGGGEALHYMFDLEFCSPRDLAQGVCGREQIWEIGCLHVATGRRFSQLVHTEELEFGTSPPEGEKVHIREALERLVEFVGPHAIMISHNCFRVDKPILEAASKRANVCLPLTWMFFDSLLYMRTTVRSKKYSLEYLCSKPMQHRALEDCVDLAELLRGRILVGPIYPPYVTALRRCRWLGAASEKKLMRHGIRSLENLVCFVCNAKISAYVALVGNFGFSPATANPIAAELETKWLPMRRNIQL